MAERRSAWLARHRWWLALPAALLTPWIGPHIDRYLPLGGLLLEARKGGTDLGFWILAAGLLVIAYLVWLLILSAIAAFFSRRSV
jgi:hypothetical protein